MKVGLLDSHAARFAPYWAAFLRELGAEPAAPNLTDAEALALGCQSLPSESLVVQLALGRILALERADTVLIPEWAHVSNDAWGEALSELLPRRISGLPPLVAVPDRAEALEAAATELGFRLTHNAGRVRLALEKVRPLATPAKTPMPALSRASWPTVAVVGPRSLLGEDVLAGSLRPALEALNIYPVYGIDLPQNDVLQRAERMEGAARVPQGERELFGAASLLAGKSAVRGLIFVAAARDAATQNALGRIAAKMHKPTLMLTIDAGQGEWPELATFARQLGAPTAEGEQPEGEQA